MTENEAVKNIKALNAVCWHKDFYDEEFARALATAIQALEEIQQYRAYKEIFESHFSKEALELLSDKAEFGKWLERGKWIAKKCDEINRKLESFEAIGTIEEFKALKEKSVEKKVAMSDSIIFKCPQCGSTDVFDYCGRCGCKIDWS